MALYEDAIKIHNILCYEWRRTHTLLHVAYHSSRIVRMSRIWIGISVWLGFSHYSHWHHSSRIKTFPFLNNRFFSRFFFASLPHVHFHFYFHCVEWISKHFFGSSIYVPFSASPHSSLSQFPLRNELYVLWSKINIFEGFQGRLLCLLCPLKSKFSKVRKMYVCIMFDGCRSKVPFSGAENRKHFILYFMCEIFRNGTKSIWTFEIFNHFFFCIDAIQIVKWDSRCRPLKATQKNAEWFFSLPKSHEKWFKILTLFNVEIRTWVLRRSYSHSSVSLTYLMFTTEVQKCPFQYEIDNLLSFCCIFP